MKGQSRRTQCPFPDPPSAPHVSACIVTRARVHARQYRCRRDNRILKSPSPISHALRAYSPPSRGGHTLLSLRALPPHRARYSNSRRGRSQWSSVSFGKTSSMMACFMHTAVLGVQTFEGSSACIPSSGMNTSDQIQLHRTCTQVVHTVSRPNAARRPRLRCKIPSRIRCQIRRSPSRQAHLIAKGPGRRVRDSGRSLQENGGPERTTP